MTLGIQDLSKYINPETAGIIWLTDESLSYKSLGVYEFNYLLDGIIMKTLSESNDHKSKINFFLGKNFGSPLFIGHVVFQEKSDLKLIDSHLEMANTFLKDNDTIYIFNRSKNTANINIQKELNNKYKHYQFEILNI